MNKQILFVFLIGSVSCSRSMEESNFQSACQEKYPEEFGFVPFSQLSEIIRDVPDEYQTEVNSFITDHPDIVEWCSVPPLNSYKHYLELAVNRYKKAKEYGNQSNHNYTFPTNNTVLKIAGTGNLISNLVSACGHDPKGGAAWQNNDQMVMKATACTGPTMQHMSTLIMQYLIEKAESSTVQPVKTWRYPLPKKTNTYYDHTNIVVQKKLPKGWVLFSTLPEKEKRQVAKEWDLKELYRLIKYAGIWNLSENNIFINQYNVKKLSITDGEKPNNESINTKAKWKYTLLGQDLKKHMHNIRNEWDGGHRDIENILKNYASDSVTTWMNLYKNDISLK